MVAEAEGLDAARAAQMRARRSDREAREERVRSRRQFAGLGSSEAIGVGSRFFATELAGEIVDGAHLPHGMKIRRIIDETSAAVETAAGEQAGVMYATSPLALEKDGKWTPTDLELRREADGRFVAVATGASLSLPAAAGQAARFARTGVAFSIPAVSEAEAVLRDGRLFYANAAGTDTDYVLKPTHGGAESFWVLRSSSSPSQLTQRFDLPTGARLEGTGLALNEPRGARVVDQDGIVLATVTPAIAYDAEGTPVPVSMSVDGSDLVLTIEHADKDLAYPILLDPGVHEVWAKNYGFENCGNTVNGTGGAWTPYQWIPAGQVWGFHYGCDLRSINWGFGLFMWMANGQYYGYDSTRNWYWKTVLNTYISHVAFVGARHEPGVSSTSYSEGYAGLYAPGVGWTHYNAWSNRFHYDFTYTDPNPHENNEVYFGLRAAANGTYSTGAIGGLEGAYVIVNDLYPPTAELAQHSPVLSGGNVGGWIGPASPPWMRLRFTDKGLGAASWSMHTIAGQTLIPEMALPGLTPTASTTVACNGSRSNACNNDYTTGWLPLPVASLPEGPAEVYAHVKDINGWPAASPTWHYKVDKTAPRIDLYGDLWNARGQTLTNPRVWMQARAFDDAPPSQPNTFPRSGAATVTVKVDGVVKATYTTRSCDAVTCTIDQPFTLATDTLGDFGGEHKIRIEATDSVGNPAPPVEFSVWYYPTEVHFGGANGILDDGPEFDQVGSALASTTNLMGIWNGLSQSDKVTMLWSDDAWFPSWAPRIDRSAPAAVQNLDLEEPDFAARTAEVGWEIGDDPEIEPGIGGTEILGAGEYRYRRGSGTWSSWVWTDESGFQLTYVDPGDVFTVEVRERDRAGNLGPTNAIQVTIPNSPTAEESGGPAVAILLCIRFCPSLASSGTTVVGGTTYKWVRATGTKAIRISAGRNQALLATWRANRGSQSGLRTAMINAHPGGKAAGQAAAKGKVAHHIVPWSHRWAQRAQEILARCGVTANDVKNGVLLNASQHAKTFTKAYIESVNRLADAYWMGPPCGAAGGIGWGNKPIREALQDIGNLLKSGSGFVG